MLVEHVRVEHRSDAVQRVPEVPALAGLRRVVRPVHADARELLGHRGDVEAGVVLREVAVKVLREHEHVLTDRVASPALEQPPVRQRLRLDVLGVVQDPA